MNEKDVRFRAYGHGGDHVGARRLRRAFRISVLGLVVFTCTLWIGERFFRYDSAERLYLNGLTFPPESARPWLRQAVSVDKAKTPRYLEALAEREEEDQILPTYARAQKLDPDNSTLAIRYGCRLFLEARYLEARAQFAQAAANAPKNALPLYLEAAVIPSIAQNRHGQTGPDVAGSLALIARANNSGNPVVFPKPLWHGDLPQRGVWYAMLRRQIIDDCCAPLYRYRDSVISFVRNQVDEGQAQSWDSWLEAMETMGNNIARSSLPAQETSGPPLPGAVPAAQAGLEIQLSAIAEREHLRASEGMTIDESLSLRRIAIQDALAKLQEFENARDERIAASRTVYSFPLNLLAWTLAILSLCFISSLLLTKIVHSGAAARAVPYPSFCKGLFTAGMALFLTLLIILSAMHGISPASSFIRFVTAAVWWSALAAWIGGGLLFPAFVLPRAQEVCQDLEQSGLAPNVLAQARRCRLGAYVVLIRRYFGVLLGLTLCLISVWVIGYRAATSMYPHQLELLVTGLAEEESDVVQATIPSLK